MKDSARLELDWLLKCNLEELIDSVRPMSAKNCEQIVRAILDRIGGPTFEQLLARIVETMIPRDGRSPPTNSDEYYFAIRDLFPQVPPENDVLGRLLCFCYADVPVADRKERQSHRALNKTFSRYCRA